MASLIVRGIFSRQIPAGALAEYEVDYTTQLTNIALDGDKPGRTVVKLRYLDYEVAMQESLIPGFDSSDDDEDLDDEEDDSDGLDEDGIAEELGVDAEPAVKKPKLANGTAALLNGTAEAAELDDEDDEDDSDMDSLDNEPVGEEKEVIICSLSAGSHEQVSVNVILPIGSVAEFVVEGPNGVHLLGHFVEQYDPTHDDYDGEYSDDDDESLNSDELGIYDPDDEDAPLHDMGMADAAMLAAGSSDEDDEDDDDLMDEDADRFAEVDQDAARAIEAERKKQSAALLPSPAKKSDKAAAKPAAAKPAAAAPAAAAPAAGDVSLEGLSKNQRKKLLKKLKAEGGDVAAAAATAKPAAAAAPAAKAAAAAAAPAEDNAAANGKKASKKQTLPGGLIIEDHKVGEGPNVKPGQKVGMRYIGKLQNGKTFDSNVKGAPFSFRLGKGEVIKGWDQGIVGMKVGGERKLTIPASLAYGKSGTDGIPGNSTLIFDIKCLESFTCQHELTLAEREVK